MKVAGEIIGVAAHCRQLFGKAVKVFNIRGNPADTTIVSHVRSGVHTGSNDGAAVNGGLREDIGTAALSAGGQGKNFRLSVVLAERMFVRDISGQTDMGCQGRKTLAKVFIVCLKFGCNASHHDKIPRFFQLRKRQRVGVQQ